MTRASIFSFFATALPALPSQVTFNRDVAPIIFEYCAPCHRPGEAAPFSLLSYEDVKKRASQMATVTESRYMPPWLPEPGYGNFAGERRLSARQIETIRKWAEQGAVEGDVRDRPPAPAFTAGWQFGPPDLLVKMPHAYTLAAGGSDVFRNFVIPIPVTVTHYVKAIEIRPGNKRIVHHANLLIDRTGLSRHLERKDQEPGFPGMNLKVESEIFDPDGYFLFWKPGTSSYVEPDGMAWRLDNGTDLVLNMHLQPSGKQEVIQASVGLYFSRNPPTKFPMLIQLEHDNALDIPAGKKDFVITDDFELPLDVDVLGVYPHAHYLGKELEGFATLPDGTRRWLIRIPQWKFNWQAVYRYTQPLFLPKGTILSMRYVYDNSAENVSNPNQPPQRVRAGNRSTDEMGHLWVQVLPRGPQDQRMLLQESWMRQRLKKEPGDFTAHYNLAALLKGQGKIEEAIEEFRRALQIEPADATALNSLGVALASEGKVDEAITQFRRALERRADYVNARYNLANLLASQDQFDEAVPNYREVLKANPHDEAARQRLAAVLQALGNTRASRGAMEEAVLYYSQSLELQPDADIYNNLGSAYARMGKLAEAVVQFEKALTLDPQHAAARRNLALAKGQLGRRQ